MADSAMAPVTMLRLEGCVPLSQRRCNGVAPAHGRGSFAQNAQHPPRPRYRHRRAGIGPQGWRRGTVDRMIASASVSSGGDSARVGVLGASGYTGAEIVRLLALHPGMQVSAITSGKSRHVSKRLRMRMRKFTNGKQASKQPASLV